MEERNILIGGVNTASATKDGETGRKRVVYFCIMSWTNSLSAIGGG